MNISLSSRDNPFASEVINAIPFRFSIGDWDSNLNHLDSMGYYGSIIGPKGTGKTTLLEQLFEKLQSRSSISTSFARIPPDKNNHFHYVSRLLDENRRGKILLVDCIERLSVLNRLRFFRSSRKTGLITTGHRQSMQPVWVRCESSPESLRYVLNHFICNFVKSKHQTLLSDATSQMTAADGNIRDVLRFLYDRAAEGRYGANSNRNLTGPAA